MTPMLRVRVSFGREALRVAASLLASGVLVACGSDDAGSDGTGGNATTGGVTSQGGSAPAQGGSGGATSGASATGGASTTGGAGTTGGASTTGGAGGGSASEDVETLAASQAFPIRLVLSDDTVYWSNNSDTVGGGLYAVPKTGGTPRQLATGHVYGLSLHEARLYYVNGPSVSIWNVPDGPSTTIVSSPSVNIVDVATSDFGLAIVDMTSGDFTAGGWDESAVLRPPALSRALRLGVDAGHFFAVDSGAGELRAWSTPGLVASVIASGLPTPEAVASDGTTAYLTLPGDGTLLAIDLASLSSEVLASGQNQPWGVAIDESFVYFTNRGHTSDDEFGCETANGTLNRLPRAGGAVEVLVAGLICPSTIVLDATHAYWVNNGSQLTHGNGSVTRLAKP